VLSDYHGIRRIRSSFSERRTRKENEETNNGEVGT